MYICLPENVLYNWKIVNHSTGLLTNIFLQVFRITMAIYFDAQRPLIFKLHFPSDVGSQLLLMRLCQPCKYLLQNPLQQRLLDSLRVYHLCLVEQATMSASKMLMRQTKC